MLNMDLLSPIVVHSLHAIIKQWQDTEQDNEDELLQLLNPAGNDFSYLCAEHHPSLAKIIPANDDINILLSNHKHKLSCLECTP